MAQSRIKRRREIARERTEFCSIVVTTVQVSHVKATKIAWAVNFNPDPALEFWERAGPGGPRLLRCGVGDVYYC